VLALWAPAALADETGGAPLDPPISDGSAASGGTSVPESQPTSTEEPPATSPNPGSDDTQPAGSESVGAGGGEPSGSGEPVEQVAAPPDRTADGETRSADSSPGGTGSPAGGGERSERSTEADAQRASGSPAGNAVTPAPQTALPISDGIGPPPASGGTGIVDLGPIAFGGAGIEAGLVALDTGGMQLLLASSLACRVISCYGGSAGSLASTALVSRLRDGARARSSASEASKLPPMPLLGAPGSPRGPFFSLLGGGGGAAAGFMLLGLVAVLAGWLVRRTDWTTAFRIPAAVWPPSAYIPPIESPG
jgi:hypothetical protein